MASGPFFVVRPAGFSLLAVKIRLRSVPSAGEEFAAAAIGEPGAGVVPVINGLVLRFRCLRPGISPDLRVKPGTGGTEPVRLLGGNR